MAKRSWDDIRQQRAARRDAAVAGGTATPGQIKAYKAAMAGGPMSASGVLGMGSAQRGPMVARPSGTRQPDPTMGAAKMGGGPVVPAPQDLSQYIQNVGGGGAKPALTGVKPLSTAQPGQGIGQPMPQGNVNVAQGPKPGPYVGVGQMASQMVGQMNAGASPGGAKPAVAPKPLNGGFMGDMGFKKFNL